MANLRQTLYAWRDNEAAKKNIELFRVLPGSALDEIVKALPRTKEELTAIKGIKEAKYREYGQAILEIVDQHVAVHARSAPGDEVRSVSDIINKQHHPAATFVPEETAPYSVSSYLDIVNNALWRFSARVKGEVTSCKFQGSALYFTIKDPQDESVMSVFMWTRDFELTGIEITEGLEVVVEGKSEVYKPSGRFSFRAQTLELAGVGALKKAYEALKKKLEAEGVFAVEKKRTLPEFPTRIGLITSKTGAVIHDFLNNLGKFGYQVRFMNSRVEGVAAVRDILTALAYFKTQPIDVLVLIRGGGSLESLQAFNNELVVHAIAEFPVPVVCAIGHDKDVPLAQLAADMAPSTPTACTVLLNESWEKANALFALSEHQIISAMNDALWHLRTELVERQTGLRGYFTSLAESFERHVETLRTSILVLEAELGTLRREAREYIRASLVRYRNTLVLFDEILKKLSATLEASNPLRQLKLGYSILSANGKVLRSVEGKKVGEHFDARLSDGILEAQIRHIRPN